MSYSSCSPCSAIVQRYWTTPNSCKRPPQASFPVSYTVLMKRWTALNKIYLFAGGEQVEPLLHLQNSQHKCLYYPWSEVESWDQADRRRQKQLSTAVPTSPVYPIKWKPCSRQHTNWVKLPHPSVHQRSQTTTLLCAPAESNYHTPLCTSRVKLPHSSVHQQLSIDIGVLENHWRIVRALRWQ